MIIMRKIGLERHFLTFLCFFIVGSVQIYAGNLNEEESVEQVKHTYTGMVKDVDGEPLIGATVMIKGTSLGTVTDVDGHYSLNGVNGKDVLVFSF